MNEYIKIIINSYLLYNILGNQCYKYYSRTQQLQYMIVLPGKTKCQTE